MQSETKPKRGRGRPPTGIRRPVVTMRLHEDVYKDVKETAARNKHTISEELAHRISRAQAIADKLDACCNEVRVHSVFLLHLNSTLTGLIADVNRITGLQGMVLDHDRRLRDA